MSNTVSFCKSLWCLSILGILLLTTIPSYATIPGLITGSYSVSSSDNCPTACTIQSGGVLTITGSSTTVIFSGNITIQEGGKLNIISGATVKMVTGTKIAIKSATSSTGAFGGRLTLDNGHITSTAANIFWSGIETSNGGSSFQNLAYAYIDNGSTVEYATVAYRNYDSGNPNINATSGGMINATFSTFRNNIRHLAIYNSLASGNPTGLNSTTSYYNLTKLFQYCKFINTSGFNPATAPPDMVYLNNCSNIGLWSCQFNNYTTAVYGNVTGIAPITAIKAVNAGFFLQPYPGNPTGAPRCSITGCRTGVSVTNSLQADRVCIAAGTDFDSCAYSVNMSGCLNPYIIGCNSRFMYNYLYYPSQFVAVYLNNCSGYKFEGNKVSGYNGTYPAGSVAGIVVKNSGTAYNEVYRNQVTGPNLGLQSIGANRDASGTTGLKILCNNFTNDYSNDISIMKDNLILSPSGIANQQYTSVTISNPFPISIPVSAGNQFSYQDPYNPTLNIAVDANTNNLASLVYRYCTFDNSHPKPIYSNLLAANIVSYPNSNTCPVHNTGAPPPPFPYFTFMKSNAAIEKQIQALPVPTPDSTDSVNAAALDLLYAQHALLIDSIIDYYQYMGHADSTGHQGAYTDSIALVYKQTTVGYQYQIYLASTYACQGSYSSALDVLSNIYTNYTLTDAEAVYIHSLTDIFTVRQWLYANNNNWTGLPPYLKDIVYHHEQDPMFAGAMARALRVEFENVTYDPYYIELPAPAAFANSRHISASVADKIYPNPTSGHVAVSWTGSNAVLVLYSTSGERVWQKDIRSGVTDMDISFLAGGTYIAEIQVNGKSAYQQKIVKR